MGTNRHRLLGLVLAIALAGCGSPGRPVAVPTFPASALPDLRTRARSLTPQALGEETPGLADELERDGFAAGTERTFSARTGELRYVEARVLRFDSPNGAAAYVAWIRGHPDLLLGTASHEKPLTLEGSPSVFRHGPSGCCSKDTTLHLAVWQRGDTALSLLVGGPDDGREILSRLAEELDALATGSREASPSP